MTEPSTEFRNQLLNVERISPELREGYRRELDAMLHPPLTARSGAIGIVLLTLLVICIGLIVRADLVYRVQTWMLVAHIALAVGFAFAAMLILRDLRKWKHSPKNLSEAGAVLTGICVFGLLEFRPNRGFYPVVSCPAFYNPAMRG